MIGVDTSFSCLLWAWPTEGHPFYSTNHDPLPITVVFFFFLIWLIFIATCVKLLNFFVPDPLYFHFPMAFEVWHCHLDVLFLYFSWFCEINVQINVCVPTFSFKTSILSPRCALFHKTCIEFLRFDFFSCSINLFSCKRTNSSSWMNCIQLATPKKSW